MENINRLSVHGIALRKKIDQHPGFLRQVAGGRIDRVQRQWRRFKGGQNRDDPLRGQRFFGNKHRRSGNPQPRAGGFDTGFGVGEFNPSAHRLSVHLLLGVAKRPVPRVAKVGVDNQRVLRQFRPVGGFAMAGKIVCGGHHHAAYRA